MEVAAVDERDTHSRVATEHACRVETAKATPDDQDAMGHRVTGSVTSPETTGTASDLGCWTRASATRSVERI